LNLRAEVPFCTVVSVVEEIKGEPAF
jgi:hypothetical protein